MMKNDPVSLLPRTEWSVQERRGVPGMHVDQITGKKRHLICIRDFETFLGGIPFRKVKPKQVSLVARAAEAFPLQPCLYAGPPEKVAVA